ncbi:MAG: hypothetical protein WAL32_11980 [Terriglobales bacterium]
MKTLLAGIAVTAGLCAISIAQSTPVTIPSAQSNSPQTSGAPLHIAPGSVIPVLLTKSIDAKKVRVGEEVEAKVTQDLKTGDGELIIPKDTKVFGHVTEAQARNKQQKESQLGIAFDHAILKNGENVPLSMSIQAIIAPPSLNPADNAGGEGPGQPSGQGGGMATGGGPTTMGGGTMPPPPSAPAVGELPASSKASARPPITGNTQGVVGIPNLNLSTPSNAPEGSIVSSTKSNVKLESGTLMLLRVNQ